MTVERYLMEAQKSSPVYVEDVFSTYIYTGTGASQTITNNIDLSTKGGLVWIKDRTNAYNHNLFDTARGATYWLHSNATSASTADSNSLTAFGTTGFTLGSGNTSGSQVNTTGDFFVSWAFRKQAKFFDVVTYTGNGSARTISHNLGATPGMIIVKMTDSSTNWAVYHTSLTSALYYMKLNLQDAQVSDSTVWNSTAPTSSVFSVGTSSLTNMNGQNYVAYLFASSSSGGFGASGTDSVVACGSFQGTSGILSVNLGWEPSFVMIKAVDSGSWTIVDIMRGDSQAGAVRLYAESAAGEGSLLAYQIATPTATGFDVDISSIYGTGKYIYLAIRRGPMKTPTSGTSVFSPLATTAGAGTTQTTGFPVDLQIVNYRPGDTDNSSVMDRLRGVSTDSTQRNYSLVTSSVNAEQATALSKTYYWRNTGYNVSTYWGGGSTVCWNFGRAPGFFDIVCYKGTGVARTVTHNLGVVPELIIIKLRSTSSTFGWPVYTATTGNGYVVYLNSNSSGSTDSTAWNNTSPTATNFTVGTSGDCNINNGTFVAYLFATLAGVSKVGTYTGTGAAQNIDCGFASGARFVMIKRPDNTGGWFVYDTARGINASGVNDPYTFMNSTAAEVTNTDYIATYSAGFGLTSTAPATMNASGSTYIYLAIA